MKKSLFALAAVGAFAGAAQAQSSVTVYGILDVGYTGGNTRGTTPSTGAVSALNTNRFSSNMESGSRVGLRGNEDLGGGLSAQFVFEVNINPAGGTGSFAGFGDMRQAFIGLTQKGLGTARIGTQNTLFWEQAGSNTAGQLAQTLGSMLAPTTTGAFTAALAPSAFTSSSGAIAGNNGAATDAYTSRTTNTLGLRTERMGGLMAKASMTLNNQNQNQTTIASPSAGYTGGNTNQFGWQAALDWNIQKANIQASFASFKSENPYNYNAAQNVNGGISGATGAPAVWTGSTQGSNVTDNQTLITASYNFGILTAYAGWTDRKVTANSNSNVYLKRTAQEIGVRGYATKTIEYWGSIGNGRFSAFGANQPTANIVGYQLGSNYWMSKRTNLYAIYGQNATSNTSNGSFSANQYSLGVRHTF